MRNATPADIPGTEGYAERADDLIVRLESVSFEEVMAPVRHILPKEPGRALDIGAGTGRDAAALASRGHEVTAVEPVKAFRSFGQNQHTSPRITWLDDSLPTLGRVALQSQPFNLILMTAVWFHLDEPERRIAMPVIADLLDLHGRLILSLRCGPIPEGRRIFHVTCEETIELAENAGLSLIYRVDDQPSALGSPGVQWSWLAFQRRTRRARLR